MPIWGAHIEMGINAHTREAAENGGAYKESVRERESDKAVL